VDDRPQTNLQLLNQLRRAGYAADDVERIKAACDFVSGHFAGWFRGSGKPFIAHLVGTAGILVAVRARAPVVTAGLSHAVYQLGELPAGTPGISRAMRARVQRVLGTEAEALVARYAALEWNVRALPALRARLCTLSPADRDVVLIRLANELDDHLDLAVLYCANAEDRRRNITAGLRLAVEIAKELGFPELASSLDRTFDATLTAQIPSALRTNHPVSFLEPPPSPWRGRPARLHRIFAGLGRRGARLLGRNA
jgi:(p)ppGpp synthase/HD superfamily hydrolase